MRSQNELPGSLLRTTKESLVRTDSAQKSSEGTREEHMARSNKSTKSPPRSTLRSGCRNLLGTGRRDPALLREKSAWFPVLVLQLPSRAHLHLWQELSSRIRRKLALRAVNLNANRKRPQREIFCYWESKCGRRGRVGNRTLVDRNRTVADVKDRTLRPAYRWRNAHDQGCALRCG